MRGIISNGGRKFTTHIIGEPHDGYVLTSFGTFHLVVDQWQWIANANVTLEIVENEEALHRELQGIIT